MGSLTHGLAVRLCRGERGSTFILPGKPEVAGSSPGVERRCAWNGRKASSPSRRCLVGGTSTETCGQHTQIWSIGLRTLALNQEVLGQLDAGSNSSLVRRCLAVGRRVTLPSCQLTLGQISLMSNVGRSS